MPDAGQGFYHDHCPQQAAGIAYRVLFSIVPLAIVLVSIFGLVLQDDAVRKDVVDAIVRHLPVTVAGRKDVENALTSIATPLSAAGLLSLALFAWAATGMMAGLTVLGGLVQRTSGSLGSFLGIGTGFIADLFLRLLTFALVVGVVLLLYRFVPARGLDTRDGVAGALLTGVFLELISLASAFVYNKATSLSVIYGSLTVGLVFLYSTYLYASALLFGAEFAAAWSLPEPTEPGPPIPTQIKRALLGLFVKQPEADRPE